MKKIFLFIAILGYMASSAQTVNDIGKISLAVESPEIGELEESQLRMLKNKILQLVTNAGLGSHSYNNNFVIYPHFTILERSIIEGGMQNINIISTELSLYIKQPGNDLLFGSTTIEIKGSGKDDRAAISAAINKISQSDPRLKEFLIEGKARILDYYSQNCTDIINHAAGIAKMHSFEEAIGLLMTIPEEIPSCHNQALSNALLIYKDYLNYHCATQIQEAKARIAENNYSLALDILSGVDPTAVCFKESSSLISSIERKVDIEEKRAWEFLMKQYSDSVQAERLRINAIKDIALAYYRNISRATTSIYIIN